MEPMTTNNGHGPAALGLPIFPQIAFQEEEYARLKMRLDIFDDMVVCSRYDVAGQVVDTYLVDPLDIAMRLSGVVISTGLLPRNTLFYQRRDGGERIGVLIEPQTWKLHVSGNKRPWTVPLPAFVFVGQAKKYSLFALSGAGWPKPETQLFAPPTPNVGGGGVCQGNVLFPAASPATIWEAVGAFFGSEFNNHLDNEKSRKYPKSILSMWEELRKAKATEYPERDLVAVATLAEVIEGTRW